MTRCNRCNGCFHWEPPDLGEPEQPKCINCGHRPMNVPYAETIREPYWRTATRPCRNCKQDAILESYCQVHLDYMVNYKLKRSRGKVAG